MKKAIAEKKTTITTVSKPAKQKTSTSKDMKPKKTDTMKNIPENEEKYQILFELMSQGVFYQEPVS